AEGASETRRAPGPSAGVSPALAGVLRLQRSAGNRAVSGLLQRAVTTSGGDWDTDTYDLVQDQDPSGRPTPAATGWRGLDITLRFKPDVFVDAESIGLTQSVQAFVNNAPNLTPAAATRAIPAADAKPIDTGKGETDEGTAIDRAA